MRVKSVHVPTWPCWRRLSPPEAGCRLGKQRWSWLKPWGRPPILRRWTQPCSSCGVLLHRPQPVLSVCTFKHSRETCVTHSRCWSIQNRTDPGNTESFSLLKYWFSHLYSCINLLVIQKKKKKQAINLDISPSCLYLTRVLVNHGSSSIEGTAVSMSGWDLMNCRVSSGNSTELFKDAAGPWPAQHPGLGSRGHTHKRAKGQRSSYTITLQGVIITCIEMDGRARWEGSRCLLGSQKGPQLETIKYTYAWLSSINDLLR